MATIKTSWTNITSANVSLTGGFTMTLYLDARYLSQDMVTNTTTRETRLRSVITNGYASGSGYEFTLTDADTLSGSAVWNFATETILTGSGAVTHNADGTKTETITATVKNNYLDINETLSGSATYPTIARASTVSCNENIPIGATYTTLTINSASADFTHKLEVLVNGSVVETLTTNAVDSYRWMPSAATYNALTPNSKELDATIRCTTYSGSDQIGSPTTVAVTLVVPYTYAPDLSNITLTVPSPCLQGVSNVSISFSVLDVIPTNSSATIASIAVTSGTKSFTVLYSGTNRLCTIQNVTVSNATVTVTDSRGYTTSRQLSWLLVPYVPVTVTGSFSRSSSTSSSVTIVITGNYYNTSLYSNTLSLRVQGTNAGGSIDNTYTTGITFNSTKNTYSKSVTLSGFTYTENYTLTLTATDNVGSATYTLYVSQSDPVFSIGRKSGLNHFDVHGALRVVPPSGVSAAVRTVDSGDNEMYMVAYNGTNLWLGARTNAMAHFLGKTYISSGYNSSDSNGNDSAYIAVPNAANDNSAYYKIYHEGFNPMVGFIDHISWASGTHNIDDAPNGLVWINWSNATISSANTIPFSSGYGWLLTVGNRFQFYFKHGSSGIQGMWVRDYTTDSTSHWFAWVQIGGGSSPSYVNGDEVSY